jgi:hypothetical protein
MLSSDRPKYLGTIEKSQHLSSDMPFLEPIEPSLLAELFRMSQNAIASSF